MRRPWRFRSTGCRTAVRRFFPAPDENLVRKGMRNVQRYPGLQLEFLVSQGRWHRSTRAGAPERSRKFMVNQDVVAVDLDDRTLVPPQERLLLGCAFLQHPAKRPLSDHSRRGTGCTSTELSHSSTISFNIGLRGPLRPEFEGIHWLYVPDRTIPFYRVGFYSNIGKGACTPGRSALYVEVGLPSEEVDRTNLINVLQPQVMRCSKSSAG